MIRHRLGLLGYQEGSDYNLETIYEKFLKLADRKGTVYDYDLEAILWLDRPHEQHFKLEYLSVTSGLDTVATATIRLNIDGEESPRTVAGVGNGPVNAVYNAIDSLSGIKLNIEDYSISSQGGGRKALGKVNIVASAFGKTYHGVGGSTDIVEASAQAYIDVLNSVMEARTVTQRCGKRASSNETSL